MLTSFAASTRSVPLGTVTLLPSIVSVTVAGGFGRAEAALSAAVAGAAVEPGCEAGSEAWLPRGADPLLRCFSSGTGGHQRLFDRAAMFETVLLVLAAEVPHRAVDHEAGRVAQRAQ